MNLNPANGPIPKPVKAPKTKGKGMPHKSKKRAKQHASPQGVADLDHMGCVKWLDCTQCGKSGPNDAHHCKDKPPEDLKHLYDVLPYGCKSGPRDTIPLCKMCHQDGPQAFHRDRSGFMERNGPDYLHIEATRRAVENMNGTINF